MVRHAVQGRPALLPVWLPGTGWSKSQRQRLPSGFLGEGPPALPLTTVGPLLSWRKLAPCAETPTTEYSMWQNDCSVPRVEAAVRCLGQPKFFGIIGHARWRHAEAWSDEEGAIRSRECVYGPRCSVAGEREPAAWRITPTEANGPPVQASVAEGNPYCTRGPQGPARWSWIAATTVGRNMLSVNDVRASCWGSAAATRHRRVLWAG